MWISNHTVNYLTSHRTIPTFRINVSFNNQAIGNLKLNSNIRTALVCSTMVVGARLQLRTIRWCPAGKAYCLSCKRLKTFCNWYCRGSLLRHTWTKKFIEQFMQHRCEIINQDVSTRGSSSADEDPRVETSWFIISHLCCMNCSINFFVHFAIDWLLRHVWYKLLPLLENNRSYTANNTMDIIIQHTYSCMILYA